MNWPPMTARNAPALITCETCGKTHPETRKHCVICGVATAFITSAGTCLSCPWESR